ncbi:4'-phosphopantetheinyl transferase superfamily protein [Streptomyces sp. NPDC002773]|uniref:4'-phosphopantetheinyl transferase family protein n=1 Tax=Streptomyces sp. NPDC002773 TaxID=3154430 RepID=UPI003331C3C2
MPRLLPRRITVVVTPTPALDAAASRAALLTAATRVCGVAPGSLRLRHDHLGRPLLSGLGEGLWVSLSHGRGLAALALSDVGPVGVDVEVPRRVAAEQLAARWFPAAEAAWVRARPEAERDLAFFWLWTHKEAMGKAYGTGLDSGGLERPGPLPPRWPPAPGRRLRPLPAPGAPPHAGTEPPVRHSVTAPHAWHSVTAPFAGPGGVLAVAALGPRARGAAVDVRLCPAPLRRPEHLTSRREATT